MIKFKEKSAFDKTLIITSTVVAAGVVIFALLFLLNIWESGIDFAIPLSGVSLVLQAIREWKSTKWLAILSIVCAGIVFSCSIAVWILK